MVSEILKHDPNLELTNVKGERASDIARRNGLDKVLGPLNPEGDMLGQGRYG